MRWSPAREMDTSAVNDRAERETEEKLFGLGLGDRALSGSGCAGHRGHIEMVRFLIEDQFEAAHVATAGVPRQLAASVASFPCFV